MLKPKVPTMPQPTGRITPPTVVEPTAMIQHTPQSPAPLAAPTAAARPTVQLTPGAVVALVGGGAAVVLVVGAVLVSMLLAVAITGVSVAICALVIRSLIASADQHR
ncbi:SpdD-like protein [Streptomyces sp. AM2-3-1]|uniref:SpdD-like protein n=1 Tax=Streptomyces sp. AM2-3-1 TaxID=3075824 RepID=UPI0028C4A5CD|nr:SpdD-like protein [Streptomyces sp. AM2-3-1]WNO64664.1 SpdD-like protein [Streptomyces sp. AM2-3-1]